MPRTVALVIGIVFLAVGLLGLVLTPMQGLLLGVFAVDLIHNLIHLAVGAAGIGAWFLGLVESRIYLQVLGVVYVVLGIIGFIPALFSQGELLGIVVLNPADNLHHLVVGAIAAYFGFSPAHRPGLGTRILGRG